MNVFTTADEMSAFTSDLRSRGSRVSLVPTMGALHRGHLSLIRRASEISDAVIVSIYVNPTQFAAGEDLQAYPRPMEDDLTKCRELGVSAVFTPSDSLMYEPDHSTYVEETDLSAGLCGKARPSHFRGVTTIVLKLFNIVGPDVAVFGRKDAQQARLIMRMVRDLNVPVAIELGPTVREPDGLAMSSRNAYLSSAERASAACIYKALIQAEAMIESGERTSRVILDGIRQVLASTSPPVALEYAEIVSDPDLQPLERVQGRAIVALAAHIGTTRLIDNIEVYVSGS
jgi:pantoate--beta-alanine ligase